MATLTRGQTFGSSETVTNTKLHNLVDLGGITNIVDADCSASMNLADTKLADITTGNKVRGSALGNLASIPSSAGVIPFANIGNIGMSLASIPNTALVPLTLSSMVDGSAMRNIQSMPSTAGQLAWYSLVASLASGSSVVFDGTSKFVGGTSLLGYSSGSYLISGPSGLGSTGSGSFTKVIEMYVPRSGTLTILHGNFNTGSASHSRVYRNGSAVGTILDNASLNTWSEQSENISGWSTGDLLQIYAYNDSGSATVYAGSVRIKENTPNREIFITGGAGLGSGPLIYSGAVAPNGKVDAMGSIGDLYINTSGGASTTLYVKTGASTWTAK